MVTVSPETIPMLRRVSVPRQSGRDALVSSLAALLDRSLMRTVTFIVEKRILPRDVDLDMLRESIHVMLDTGIIDKPQSSFTLSGSWSPEALPELPGCTPGNDAALKAEKFIVVNSRVSINTTHTCHSLSRRLTKNDAIQFEHWVHQPDREVGSVIVLHGFAMGWPVIDAMAMSASQWFARGFNVILLTLPDHGPRRAPGTLFSGQSFTVPHAVHLATAVRRAMHEIFEIKRWLRSQSDRPVGLVGMSLGGYLASLCAGLSDDFDFLIPLVPPACMGDLAWRVYRDTGHHKAGLDDTLTEENMRAAFYIHSPLAHPRKIAKERILIAAGAGDRIVPPEHPSALWEHWDQPRIHWFRGSHLSPVASRSLMRVVTQHLQKLDIL